MPVFLCEIKVDAYGIIVPNVDGYGVIAFHRLDHVAEIID